MICHLCEKRKAEKVYQMADERYLNLCETCFYFVNENRSRHFYGGMLYELFQKKRDVAFMKQKKLKKII